MLKYYGIIGLFWVILACNNPAAQQQGAVTYSGNYAEKANNPEFLHASIRRIVDIIRYDVFAPPVASRIFSYASVAGYEAIRPGFPEYQSLAGQLKSLTTVPQPDSTRSYCFPLAGANAMLVVGKALVFSEGGVEEIKEDIFDQFRAMNMPPEVYERSMLYGEQVARHILEWSRSDQYAETRSAPKFTIDSRSPSRWQPTPPMYADALEPHWNQLRTWVIDSASHFPSDPPVRFSSGKGSAFYQQAMEVYLAVKNLSPADSATAWYWDDNPFTLEVSGHLSFGRKKISPGGHWMLITSTACRDQKASLMESAAAYVRVSCALSDAFISCWDCKYRTNLIRPETYINEYIDPAWQPLIQTPPFPEHTSGHSAVSAAAAAALTQIFGEAVPFTDSTEFEFGIPPRSFSSFNAAADQVAESRFYGGIHYRRGNIAGKKNGNEIGTYICKKLQIVSASETK